MSSESRKVSAPFKDSEKSMRHKRVKGPPIENVILSCALRSNYQPWRRSSVAKKNTPSNLSYRAKMCSHGSSRRLPLERECLGQNPQHLRKAASRCFSSPRWKFFSHGPSSLSL